VVQASQPVGTATTPAIPTVAKNDLADKDTFLKLLVAQLKYQNPMQPTDPSTFLAQSAQFSMVEKLDELTKLAQARQATDQVVIASSLVGKRVGYLVDGQVNHSSVQGVRFDPSGAALVQVSDTREIPLSDVQQVLPAQP